MATQELKGKIFRKAKNGKGFLMEGNENWFNAADAVVPVLAKLNIGDEVEISYFKKGVRQEVTMIKTIAVTAPVKTESAQGTAEFTCEECGKDLKTGKYKKCYDCNQKSKGGAPKSKVFDEPQEQKKWQPKSDYNSSEKTAQIQKGNALNAAASVLSGADCIKAVDPETIGQITIVVAVLFLDYLKSE